MGTKTPIDFYETRAWRELRLQILQRDGWVCRYCGGRAPIVPLHVDHIKPRSRFPELELEAMNLQVLCEDCNIGKGAKMFKPKRKGQMSRTEQLAWLEKETNK